MNVKFKNKYRIKSTRLPNWNYAREGSYFITICTQDKEHYFGDVRNGTMFLNESGKIAAQCWQEIPCQFSFIKLDNFVIMPNHVHGILTIDNGMDVAVALAEAKTRLIASLPLPMPPEKSGGGVTGDMNPMRKNNISRVIRWYKGRCSFDIHKINPDFQWQSRYHDHIIRNNSQMDRIRNYIVNNPFKWDMMQRRD